MVYWTNCVVTSSVAGREFSFDVVGPQRRVFVSWSYRIEETETGALVTECFELGHVSFVSKLYEVVAGRRRTARNSDNIRATLERVKAVAESNFP